MAPAPHRLDEDADLSLYSAPKCLGDPHSATPQPALASFGRLKGGTPKFHVGALLVVIDLLLVPVPHA